MNKQLKDEVINKITQEIANELKLDKENVDYAVSHSFNWVRESLIDMKYCAIFMQGFGSFEAIRKRLNENDSEVYLEYKNKNKNRKNKYE